MMTKTLGPENITADVSNSVARFHEDPRLRLGDADSGHGVIFGWMEGQGMVAVKPHTKAQRAVQEAHNLVAVEQHGLDAIQPITVASGGLAHYLVTNYRPGLAHLGQTQWDISAGSPALRAVTVPSLHFGASVIADRHNHGVFNLDSQVRNIAMDRAGAPVVTDAEKLVFKQSADIVNHLANKDVSDLGKSVLHRGLLADRGLDYRVGYLAEYILEPYFDAVKPDMFAVHSYDRTESIQADWDNFLRSGNRPSS